MVRAKISAVHRAQSRFVADSLEHVDVHEPGHTGSSGWASASSVGFRVKKGDGLLGFVVSWREWA